MNEQKDNEQMNDDIDKEEVKKTVIPIMFYPYSGETVESWFLRLAKANGMKNVEELRKIYMPDIGPTITTRTRNDFQVYNNIGGLYWWKKNIQDFPDLINLFLFHTPYPLIVKYEEPSVSMYESLQHDVQSILYNCGLAGHDVKIGSRNYNRKICLQCLNEDVEKGYEPYIRVWHQVTFVKVCAVHKTPLVKVDYVESDKMRKLFCTLPNETTISEANTIYEDYRKPIEYCYAKPNASCAELGCNVTMKALIRDVFVYVCCNSCGLGFLTTIYAMSSGWACPECSRRLIEAKLPVKMSPRYRNAYKQQ